MQMIKSRNFFRPLFLPVTEEKLKKIVFFLCPALDQFCPFWDLKKNH